MRLVSRLLFRLARSRLLDVVVRFGFAHLSMLLPVRRVRETAQVIAFHHPRPAWAHHLLFVPKVGIPSLLAVRPEQAPLVRDLILLALEVACNEPYRSGGFALMVNGGAYQDVGQLHFHLAAPVPDQWYEQPVAPVGDTLLESAHLWAFHHPRPRRATHIVLLAKHGRDAGDAGRPQHNDYLEDVIAATQTLTTRLRLVPGGYTLVAGGPPGTAPEMRCFHLVAGGRIG